jgi:hypothetical protein
MRRKRYDWFLLILFLANAGMGVVLENYEAALGWGCATMIMLRAIATTVYDED